LFDGELLRAGGVHQDDSRSGVQLLGPEVGSGVGGEVLPVVQPPNTPHLPGRALDRKGMSVEQLDTTAAGAMTTWDTT